MKEIIIRITVMQESERGITCELVISTVYHDGLWFPEDPQLAMSYLPPPEEHLGRNPTMVYY